MANVFSTATLGLRVDTNQFNKNMTSVRRTTTQALESMRLGADAFDAKWKDLTDGIKETKRIISGILISQGFYTLMNGLTMGAAAALEFSMNMETAAVSMEYFVEGSDKAAKSLAFLREMNEFAAETPFSTEDALSMSKHMQAVGIQMETTKSVLQVITDAAAATGATQENLQRIVFALGQMQTKGRIANEEIRQLANANIPIYEILQEELKLTGEEISNIGNYWIDSEKAIAAILRGLEKRYDGASEKISNTVSGMTDTITDDLKIIAQEAGSGVYDALANNLTVIRDALDRYRTIATEQGSMGLFNQILIDLDATGRVGEQILALIGNARQLGAQLQQLYLNGQPLIRLFGEALYASISTAGITLTGFLRIANSAVEVLNDLGITSGTTAQVISSLYVAYKAATWLGSMGQAAMAAGYRMYELTAATLNILPASLQAHKGIALLTSGLVGLITYGLAAYGIFRSLNNTFAGLDTSKTGGNIFPDDYSEAMKEYQQAMDEYNERIQQYQDDFNKPYSEIADGTQTAVDGLEEVEKESDKAAKAVKNDWVASFDEVYSIPDQNASGTGTGDTELPEVPDYGLDLTLPEVKFPTIDEALPEMPEFPWDEVYDQDWMNTDVLDPDWWKSLLPFVLVGAAMQLGKVMSKNRAAQSADIKKAGKGIEDVITLTGAEQHKILRELSSKFDDVEDLLSKTLVELRNPKNSRELNELLSRNLDALLDSSKDIVKKLGAVQDALKLTGGARRSLEVYELALKQSQFNKLLSNLDSIAELQGKLADDTLAISAAGEALRREVKGLRDDTVKAYLEYAGKYGNDELLEGMAETLGIHMPSMTTSLEDFKRSMQDLIGLAADGFKDVEQASELLSSAKKSLSEIANSADALGLTAKGVEELRGELAVLSKAITARQSADTNKALYNTLKQAFDNKDALDEIVGLLGVEKNSIEGILDQARKVAGQNDTTAEALAKIATTFDELKRSTITARQLQIEYNKAFTKSWSSLTENYLPKLFASTQAVEKYGSQALKQFSDGTSLLNKMSKAVDAAAEAAAKAGLPVASALGDLQKEVQGIVKGTGEATRLTERYLPSIITLIGENGKLANADAATIAKQLAALNSNIATELSKIDTKGITKYFEALRQPVRPTITGDAIKVALNNLASTAARSTHSIEEAFDKFFDKADKLLRQSEIRDGVASGTYVNKYNSFIDEVLTRLRGDFYIEHTDTKPLTRGLSQETFKTEMRKIGAEIRTLPDAQVDKLGKGIRSTAFDVLNSLEASNTENWKNFERVLKQAGLFDLNKALVTGGDLGALFTGQTSFGTTAVNTLISNLINSSALKDLLRTPPGSAQNAVARLTGNEAELPALRILSEYLEENNKALYKTANYIDESRRVLVQLDGAIGDLAGASMPVDTKVLASSSYNKILQALQGFAEIDGKSIKVGVEGFARFLALVPDYALQIAAQAAVMGSSNAALAIFDHQLAGLTKTLENVSDINVATREGENILKSRIRQAIVEGLTDSTVRESFASSMRLIEFTIPEEAKALVYELADDFRRAEIAISEYATRTGASVEELAQLFANRFGDGTAVGYEGLFRYLGSNFSWNNVGPKELNQIINRAIEPLLKSGRPEYIAEGVRQLEVIQSAIKDGLASAKKGTAALDNIKVQLHTNRLGGAIQEVQMSVEKAYSVLSDIQQYQKVMSGYQYALVTQNNDFLRIIENARVLGKSLSDSAYETMRNGQKVSTSLEEIVKRAIRSTQLLEEIYDITDNKISKQLMDMLDLGRPTEITNPFGFADINKLADALESFANGTKSLEALSTTLPEAITKQLGNAIVDSQAKIDATVRALKEGAEAQKAIPDAVQAALDELDLSSQEAAARIAEEAAKKLDSAVTDTAEAAAHSADTAEETVRAARHSTNAAEAAAEAAEAAADAAKATRKFLDNDALFDIFAEIKFDPDKLYTIIRDEIYTEVVAKIRGSRLIAAQEAGKDTFVRSTILDELGKTLYEPVQEISDSLMDFLKLLDVAAGPEGSNLASLTGIDEFLKIQVNFADAIFAKAAEKLGKEVGETLTDTVSKQMDAFFKSADAAWELDPSIFAKFNRVLSDAVLETLTDDDTLGALTKVIEEAYGSVGDDFLKNLQILLGADLDTKFTAKFTKYLDSVLEDGVGGALGTSADDLGRYLKEATKQFGTRFNKKYADEIAYAAEETLTNTSKTISDAIEEMTPTVKYSDEMVDMLEEAAGAAAKEGAAAASDALKGIKASDIILGGSLGVGLLDIAGIGLEGYFASGDAAQLNNYMQDTLRSDSSLDAAIKKLDDAGVSLADLASTGDGLLHSISSWFGGGDLSNAAMGSVGVEIGATGAGAAAAGLVGLVASGAWIPALVGAGVSAGGSLIYGLTGGDTIGNQYSDAYIEALKNDTIYENALKAGLTEDEARKISDAELKVYGDAIFSDLDTGFWKGDDLNKFLYGSTDGYEQAASRLKGSSDYATQNRLMRLMQALGDKDIYMVNWDSGYSSPLDYGTGGAATAARGQTWQQMVADSEALGLSDVLYQTGNLEGMTQLLDYIFKGANYDSDVAKEFFANYGEEELDYLRGTEYGVYMEAYDNAEAFVGMLNELGVLNEDFQTLVEQDMLGSIVQAAVNFKNDADASMANMLDVLKAVSSPFDEFDGARVRKEASWIADDDNLADDRAGEALLGIFEGMSEELTQQLLDEYGIAIDAQVKEFTNSSGQLIKEVYSSVQIDKSKLQDDIVGWTIKPPENISLDGAALSANDIEVLAQAGIQINSDGTISFMKALNENLTGTERESSLTMDDIAISLLNKLSGAGVAVNTTESGSTLNLDTASLAGQMSSAMFRTTLTSGEVSALQDSILSGLGRVLDSGFIEITNKAVLSGQMTVEEYLNGLGTSINALSPEIQEELKRIDAVIAQGGEASALAVAEWADGIVIPSPISAEELTPEIEAAFKEVGISFEQNGNQLMMVINHLGNDLKDGMTLIPEETWNSLNESVKLGLQELGVTWTTEAGYVKVNIAGTLGSLITTSDITPQIEAAMDTLGYSFKTSGDRIVGIVDSTGQLVKGNLLKIPRGIYDEIDPQTITALEQLGVDMQVKGNEVFMDMSALMSTGVGTLVATFVEQPELWNQIPEQVKATLVAAGIATEDGLLKINANTITGLQPVGDTWVGFWQNFPSDTRDAFSEAGIATDDGLFQIRKYIDESSVPEGVDSIIRKFDELPPEMQEAILASGEAINENGYVIYNATADAVQSMEEAIVANKNGAITAAEEMAAQIGTAVSQAIMAAAQLENMQQRAKQIANSGLFHWGETVDMGSEKNVGGKGYTVFKTFASSGGHNGYVVISHATGEGKRYGKNFDIGSFKGFASGGTVGKDDFVLAGERGREMAVLPDGRIIMLGEDGAELTDLPKGTKILNNNDTEEILKYTGSIDSLSIAPTGLGSFANGTVGSSWFKKQFEDAYADAVDAWEDLLDKEKLDSPILDDKAWKLFDEATSNSVTANFTLGKETWDDAVDELRFTSPLLDSADWYDWDNEVQINTAETFTTGEQLWNTYVKNNPFAAYNLDQRSWQEFFQAVLSAVQEAAEAGKDYWESFIAENPLEAYELDEPTWQALPTNMSEYLTAAGEKSLAAWDAFIDTNPLSAFMMDEKSWELLEEDAKNEIDTVVRVMQDALDKAKLKATVSVTGSVSLGMGDGMAFDDTVYGSGGGFISNFLQGTGWISSPFGYRNKPNAQASSNHRGVDIAAAHGTPIKAGIAGTVYRKYNSSYGNYVDIVADNGSFVRLAHMSGYNRAFGTGSRVQAGNIVGYVGSTGNSTGPHVHVEYHPGGGAAANPMRYFYADGGDAAGLAMIAEKGRELAIMPDGSIQLLDKAQLYDVPNGTHIINNRDTEKMLRYAGGMSGLGDSVQMLEDGNTTVEYTAPDTKEILVRVEAPTLDSVDTAALPTEEAKEIAEIAESVKEETAAPVVTGMPGYVDPAIAADTATATNLVYVPYIEAQTETIAVAIRGAVAAFTEADTAAFTKLTSKIETQGTTLTGAIDKAAAGLSNDIDSAAARISSAVSNIRLTLPSNLGSSGSSGSGGSSGSSTEDDFDWRAEVEAARKDFDAATSDAERELAHLRAEAARATVGFSGGADGSKYISITDEEAAAAIDEYERKKKNFVKASAYGSVVKGDQLVRVGEFGKEEAILPLEQPSVMAGVGETIGEYVTPITGVTVAELNEATDKLIEAWNVALRGAVAAFTESTGTSATAILNRIEDIGEMFEEGLSSLESLESLPDSLSYLSVLETLPDTLSELNSLIQSNLQATNEELEDKVDDTTVQELPAGFTAEFGQWYVDSLAAARESWHAADTDEERAAAHQTAEDIRALLGFSGGPDGSQHIPLSENGIANLEDPEKLLLPVTTALTNAVNELIKQLTAMENADKAYREDWQQRYSETNLKWSTLFTTTQNSVMSVVESSALTVANAVGSYVNWSQNTISALQAEVESLRAALSAKSLGSIKGSAKGSLVTKDALYRLGEEDLNEAIIPLEQPSVMSKVGASIASYVPTPAVDVSGMSTGTATTVLDVSAVLVKLDEQTETIAVAIRGAVAAFTEATSTTNTELFTKLTDSFTSIDTKLEDLSALSKLDALSDISSNTSSLSSLSSLSNVPTLITEFKDAVLEKLTTDTENVTGTIGALPEQFSTEFIATVVEQIAAAKAAYAAATTDEEREAAHVDAEAARALLGYSGGPDGSDFIPLRNEDGTEFSENILLQTESISALHEADREHLQNFFKPLHEELIKKLTTNNTELKDKMTVMQRSYEAIGVKLSTQLINNKNEIVGAIQSGATTVANAVGSYVDWSQNKIASLQAEVDSLRASLAAAQSASSSKGGSRSSSKVSSGLAAAVGAIGTVIGVALGGARGSASGSLVTKDALYRAGEYGLNEAIIPLERPDVMKQVGSTIASFMPVEYSAGLARVAGMENAGISMPTRSAPVDQMALVDQMTQRVLEVVIPQMAYAGGVGDDVESRRPLYVGTLVADERGLKALERKLYEIRQLEESRRL